MSITDDKFLVKTYRNQNQKSYLAYDAITILLDASAVRSKILCKRCEKYVGHQRGICIHAQPRLDNIWKAFPICGAI